MKSKLGSSTVRHKKSYLEFKLKAEFVPEGEQYGIV